MVCLIYYEYLQFNMSHSSKENQMTIDFSYYKNFKKVESIKDFKFYREIKHFKNFQNKYLTANVEKIFLFCQLSRTNQIIYISENPYLTELKNLVFLYSKKQIGKHILQKETNSNVGEKIINTLKKLCTIYQNDEKNRSTQFNKFISYFIDQKTQLENNQISMDKIEQQLISFDFTLKRFLKARISRNILLTKLTKALTVNPAYRQVLNEGFKIANTKRQSIQQIQALMFQSVKEFLRLCTLDQFLIFPAKKTVVSKDHKNLMKAQNGDLLTILIVGLESKNNEEQTIPSQDKKYGALFKSSNPSPNCQQLIFALNQILQKNQQFIQITLQTKFEIAPPTEWYFQQLFNSVLQKYKNAYLIKPFLSSIQQNMNLVQFQRKQFHFSEPKLGFAYKVPYILKQNFIQSFIEAIDILTIIYLVFQQFLLELQKEKSFLQNLMESQNFKKRQNWQNEIATDLYVYSKYYLENFAYLKRKYL